MKKVKLFTACFLLVMSATQAAVRLPLIFSSNMVLQRDKAITVWGWADPKEKVTVQFNRQSKSVTTGKDGTWKVTLANETAGGPYTLEVKGKNTLTLANILVGDVWVCSGQSNMEWTVNNSNNAAQEIAHGNFPQIRHFKVPNTVASTPLADLAGGEWKVCTPETVGDFTAVGYFFARILNQEDLNIPIGLINTSWGGTHVETWTSREAFEKSEEFKSMIASMPHLNLDSLAKQKTIAANARIKHLQGSVNDPPVVVSEWKTSEYNDSQWPKMVLPSLWEQRDLGDIDGKVWFRKTIDVLPPLAGKEAELSLAKIDDSDETFVNGVPVGKTINKYSAQRAYHIPAGVLKAGKNVIAIRVDDTGGGGGVYGEATDMKISIGSTTLPLAGEWVYRVESLQLNAGIGPNSYPTLLFNGMVHPLLPFAIKGALWYQGEANAGRAYQYRKAFPLMITDWRTQWKQGDFPFYFVQLATFGANHGNSAKGSDWAELREAQTLTLSLPNTGMAVTTDIGDPGDIHPRNKQDVGKRLAAIALSKTYGKNNVYSGPTYQAMRTEGNKVIITFSNLGSGLLVKDAYGYVKGFEVAGDNRIFSYAKAEIQGNTVVVHSENINNPVAVRFGWADDAGDDNLYNKEGFPAAPFRTDTWEGITTQHKFTIEP